MNKSKENFTTIMSSLQQQHDSDIQFAKDASILLKSEVNPYNNSLLVKLLVDVMASWFGAEDSKDRINHFMYGMDFGRYKEKEVVSINDLWDSLVKNSQNE
ncbi:hypothetical protein Phi13:2_gp074 [Cellulophaga phage phi13:2]|uniref:Uncharacterized protein n=3 Tax=Baltivirus TaxID=2946816 RepID=S0A1C2_9CAUD|nr:hypothetical protein Phi19:3_gp073 [Cellulophaga phage phi19:3]YP_008241266.1 hypothetical protein Phi18:3_gp073 [Cellulophaga phage phi18:3]YP_008242099.1 hypothetical protein Phi13:2_gp074 [Cellulophaga phage phi13:2]AGO47477.1 hypothetical protein Phi19:3_gp073 [Cellulophaga phage phi19:3]AGO48585.1 hypothetical protein Phi18:3_gp073 [Cellulophaga phage phi18:3]AGO49684.1 hypothetical protein Phi13:2_gp074 [Cellulophaga phage phi13:2]